MDARLWRFKWFVLVLILFSLVCGGAGAQSPGEEEHPPLPAHFQIVDPEAILRGTCATLVWETPLENEWALFLDDRPVDPAGGARVCPEETTTYHLVVETPGGRAEKFVTLNVVDMGLELSPESAEMGDSEVSANLTADPSVVAPGSCATLFWSVEPAGMTAILDGQVVESAGERQVCPERSRPYDLIIEGTGVVLSRQVYVLVQGSPAGPLVVPTATQQQPPPQQPQQAAASGLSADLRPSDLYADNQPQGVMWGRITNDGHGTLAGQTVLVSGTGTATPRSGGTALPLGFAAKQYTLNIAPGETQTINLGWPVDTTQYSYEFTLQVQPADFTDPNPANNSYSEAVVPTGPPVAGVTPALPAAPGTQTPAPPAPPAQPGVLSADVKPTDLYPDKKINGVMWARITNRGPGTLSGNKVSVFGFVTETPWSGAQATSKNLPAQEFTLNVAPGQEQQIKLGWPLDLSKSRYDFSVTVNVKDFSDPNPGNNTYSERVEDKSAVPVPPPAPNITMTVPGLVADVAPVSMTAAYGTFHVNLQNNGPAQLSNAQVDWKLSVTSFGMGGAGQSTEVRQGSAKISLKPGQKDFFDTSVPYDLTKYSHYNLTVEIKPKGFTDTNMGNNTYTQRIPKQ